MFVAMDFQGQSGANTLPAEQQEHKEGSSEAMTKTRVKRIKFNLEPASEDAQKGKRLHRQSSSNTDPVGILKNKQTPLPPSGRSGNSTKAERRVHLGKKRLLRKTGVSQSLGRMFDAVNAKKGQEEAGHCSFSCLSDHMAMLKRKQLQTAEASIFHESDPALSLSLEEFHKGSNGRRSRRRRSAMGKSVPLQRRSYPSTRFEETELPPLVPYPAKPTVLCGRLSPVYFDCGKSVVSNLLGLNHQENKLKLPLVTPEQNDSTALSA